VVASVTASGNHAYLAQRIEDVRSLAGQTVTISFHAKASAAGLKIGMGFRQYFGSGGSPQVNVYPGVIAATLTTSWARYEATMTINSVAGKTIGSAGDDYLMLMLWMDAGSSMSTIMPNLGHQSGTFDIAQVQLEVGSAATSFDDRPIGLETLLCHRFYETATYRRTAYNARTAAANDLTTIPFLAEKRAAPALTLSNVSETNCTGSAANSSKQNFVLVAAASAGSLFSLTADVTADAEL
jgi:hypothetical protein